MPSAFLEQDTQCIFEPSFSGNSLFNFSAWCGGHGLGLGSGTLRSSLGSALPGPPREALGLSETQFPLKETEAEEPAWQGWCEAPTGRTERARHGFCTERAHGAVSAPSLGAELSAGCRKPSS